MKKQLLQSLTFFSLLVYVSSVDAQSVTPANALKSYINNKDTVYNWVLKDTFSTGTVKGYNLLLTSQKWRNIVWTHQLTLFVPAMLQHDAALLFITGGSNKSSLPNWNNNGSDMKEAMAAIATSNKAVAAVLRQTPNQPLFGNLTEDALISYTLHNFKKDGDYTWPLLFPMVKSATRAMDAIESFTASRTRLPVKKFLVSGASKRGWTTWLTGAVDKRVKAIAPMVIDILNMPVSLDYQIKTWKEYSIQIQDYVDLGIPQDAHTPSGTALSTMIDPYSYRKDLAIPKMLFMGTNDPYWVIDNVKNYLDSMPGKTFLNYVPNAGHELGDTKQAFQGLSAFFGLTIKKAAYPECKWKTSATNGSVTVGISATADKLLDVIVWSASTSDLDFRNETWKSRSLGISGKPSVMVKEALPASGYRAFYVDLKYDDNKGGSFLVSTRVFVTDTTSVL